MNNLIQKRIFGYQLLTLDEAALKTYIERAAGYFAGLETLAEQ